MDEKYIKAFNAIVTFICDLWEGFGDSKVVSPLALYKRLIDHIKFTDSEAIIKSITGFNDFFKKYEVDVLNNNLKDIPEGSIISYGDSDKVYIDVANFIHKSDNETCEVIRRHLMTISAILDPNKKKIEELEKHIEKLPIDNNTPEGEFLSGIMNKVSDSMEKTDLNNPMQAIAGLMQSGVLGNLITGLQDSVTNKNMDPRKLLGQMQNIIGSLMPPPETKDEKDGDLPPPNNRQRRRRKNNKK